MNNSSLLNANSATHIKIVAVSLIAGILVIGVGLAARHDLGTDIAITSNGRMEARGPIIKAGKPMAVTTGAGNVIR
jgi:hypothetical protein